jgi:hypothetical protein
MQNLESGAKFSCGLVIAVRGKLRHFPQSNCRQKQEKKPYAAADVSGGVWPQKPGDRCNREHNDRREPPAVIPCAGSPRTGQH